MSSTSLRVARVLVAVVAVVAAVHAGAGAAPRTPDAGAEAATMFRGNAQLTGVYDAPPPRALAGVRFTFKADGPIRGTPAVAGGLVYVGSGDGVFHAIDAVSGHERWSVRTGGAITSSAAVAAGTVYIASRDGMLQALDARSGRVRWRHDLGPDAGTGHFWDYHQSSPVVDGGVVFIGSGAGRLVALDARTGRVRWTFAAGARIRTTPAVGQGLVVFGTLAGGVIALDRATGRERWTFATQGASHVFADRDNDSTSIVASPSIAEGVVTIGGRDGIAYALDLATGRLMWQNDHDGSSWVLSTAIGDGVAYSGSGSALFVQAADLRTGAERWRFKTRAAIFSSLTLAGDTLLLADFTGNVYALDRADGHARWVFPMGHRSLATPVVAGDTVYCAADDGVLYALGASASPRVIEGPVERVVYWEGRKTPQAFSWFQNDVDRAVLGHFRAAGYRQVDAQELGVFLAAHATGTARSVVVFADNRMPPAIAAGGGNAPIRRYLDAGGKVALLGANPLAYRADPATGDLEAIDFAVPAEVFGLRFDAAEQVNGYYASRPTAAGRQWGLRAPFVGFAGVPAQAGVTALASDEFGVASAWVRSYGGPAGTGLLQLSIPRGEIADLADVAAAVDFGIGW